MRVARERAAAAQGDSASGGEVGRRDGQRGAAVQRGGAKALRKEPGRRYASVAALSEDLRRHGEGLPVSARHVRLPAGQVHPPPQGGRRGGRVGRRRFDRDRLASPGGPAGARPRASGPAAGQASGRLPGRTARQRRPVADGQRREGFPGARCRQPKHRPRSGGGTGGAHPGAPDPGPFLPAPWFVRARRAARPRRARSGARLHGPDDPATARAEVTLADALDGRCAKRAIPPSRKAGRPRESASALTAMSPEAAIKVTNEDTEKHTPSHSVPSEYRLEATNQRSALLWSTCWIGISVTEGEGSVAGPPGQPANYLSNACSLALQPQQPP